MAKHRLFKNNSRQPQWEDPRLLEHQDPLGRAEAVLVSRRDRAYSDRQQVERLVVPVLS